MRKHLNPSLVLSVVAVFIALGGTSYALTQLPKNSVGPKQIKKNAVNSAKVKDRSLLARDFRKGQLPKGATGPAGASGSAGPTGPTGATGEPGSALAFAYVQDIGNPNDFIPADKAKNMTSSMVSKPTDPAFDEGIYCFELSSLGTVRNAQVTPEPQFNNLAESDKFAAVQILENSDFGFECPNTSDMVVVINDASTGTPKNWFFYVTLN